MPSPERLRLLFDATVLGDSLVKRSSRTGIYFTAYNIFRELVKRKDIELVLYTNRKCRLGRYLKRHSFAPGEFEIVSGPRGLRAIDAVFSPGTMFEEWVRNRFPRVSCYNVLYDIIPILHPEYFPFSQSPAMSHTLDNFQSYDHYFVISESTKNDVIRMGNGITADMMTVIPLAANERFRQNRDKSAYNALRQKYRIPGNKKYMLSLCTREPRKNLVNTIRAFIEFVEVNNIDDMVYVLAGGIWNMFRGELRKRIADFDKHADKILEIGYVDDDDLAPLYSNALWFVYTPHYEGFGLPPLEAMQCGCPVIVSSGSSLPEVVGDAGIAVDSRDVAQHVRAYEKYYRDPALRAGNAEKGLARAKLFSWDRCVDIIGGKIASDWKRKLPRPGVSVAIAANCADAAPGSAAFERCVDSVRAQKYPDVELLIVDGCADASTSSRLDDYAAARNLTVRKIPGTDVCRAFNAALAEIGGEYAAFLEPDATYTRPDFLSACVAKTLEAEADLSYTDAETGAPGHEKLWRGDLRKLPFGEHFSTSTVLVRTAVLREAGGFPEQYGTAAYNAAIMRMARDGRRLRHIPALRVSVGGLPSNADGGDAFARAYYDVFGREAGLTLAEAEGLYAGACLRKEPNRQIVETAAKLPYETGGGALLEKLIRNRSSARIADEDRRDWLENSRHLLFGFLPLTAEYRGNAINNTTIYSLAGLFPLLSVTRREGARASCYLFTFIPLFRTKRNP